MNRSTWKTPAPFSFLVLFLALYGCGAGPGPNLSGPEGTPYLTAYSGTWVLLRLDSDDLDARFREAMAGRPGASAGGMPGAGASGSRGGGMTGGRPGGGMTGGRPGGGRVPGGMPGTAGGMDAEEMRRVMQATTVIARTPTEMSLELRPESITLIRGDLPPVRLGLGEEEIAVNQDGAEFFAKAEWTSEGLIIQRKVDRGGAVKDKMTLDEDGRLIVEREIDALRGGKVEGTLVYRKKEG